METQQEGIVLEVFDGTAKVKTSRHNDCENCGACPGNSAIVLEADNSLGAKPGQRVAVEVQEVNMLKAAFIVYVLPLIAIFVGVLIGNVVAEKLGYAALWFQVGGGIVAFILAVVYIKYYDYRSRGNDKMRPVITRILS